jgi:exodeoxyribonuclease III
MSWNILTGGRADRHRSRLDDVVHVIQEEDPDIVFLQEACGFGDSGEGSLEEFGAEIAMHGTFAAANTQFDMAVFLKPNVEVRNTLIDRTHFFHVLLVVEVVVDAKYTIPIAGVHLCPDSPDTRAGEAFRVARLLRNYDYAIAVGDFNTLDPHSGGSEALLALHADHRFRYAAPDSGPQYDRVDSRVIDCMNRAGFVDVGLHFQPAAATTPTDIPVFDNDTTELRLDYVWFTRSIQSTLLDFSVLDNETTRRASDHYPLLVTFEVPNT